MNDPIITDAHKTRNLPLNDRYHGLYRARVLETNDPLGQRRIKVYVPELHQFAITAEDAPWASPSFILGGKNAGQFVSPVVGDIVWVQFEKGHPYGIVWTGYANALFRQWESNFAYIGTNDTSRNQIYRPIDNRPMDIGWQDKYGNVDIISSVGFIPSEHDPTNSAIINQPDLKYMAKITKYGHVFIMGDQGYYWKKSVAIQNNADQYGEFTGNFETDKKYEWKRTQFYKRLLNENQESPDARKIMLMTRYGHKFEMRDVGYGQYNANKPSKSTKSIDEYGSEVYLSTSDSSIDERWIKFRTKAGMLIQMSDIGAKADKISRIDISDQEDKHWRNKDGRWMRFMTPSGIKMVLDDRGYIKSDQEANGFLLKGVRGPGVKNKRSSQVSRGFYFEFNENDAANHMSMGTPVGQSIELNDRYQYIMIASTMGQGWSPKNQGLKSHEFIRKPMAINDPETTTHHLKIDLDNEYVRFKTRANKGVKPIRPANLSSVSKQELNQGLEARDGYLGDGAWVELVDCQNRGLWFSKKYQFGIWRAKQDNQMYIVLDDNNKQVLIYNGEQNGQVHVYSANAINIVSNGDISINTAGRIDMRAARGIFMNGQNTTFSLSDNVKCDREIYAKDFIKQPQLSALKAPVPTIGPIKTSPNDRGATYNKPFEECPIEEVDHVN